jgi:hypothetical protein
MSLGDLARRRLCAQGISCSFPEAHDAVTRLTAVQAQERPSALWAIGLRTGMTSGGVERAVTSGSIIRTWLMRGTLHFTAAEDVRWLLDLLAPRVIAGSRYRDEQLGLDDEAYGRSGEVLAGALEDRRRLTRSEMMRTLEGTGISTAGQRGYHILRHLALKGLICFGPMVGREPSFVLLDDVAPRAKSIPREEALAKLARRYFAGHGPAGVQDLVWWSGITVPEARKGIELARPGLTEETCNGTMYWSAPGSSADDRAAAHLLPAFDEYIIGYRDRSAVLDQRHTQEVLSSNGIFYPAMLIDRRVRGTWRAAKKKNEVTVEARPFSRLTPDELLSLREASALYQRFIGLPVTLSFADTP